MAVFQIKWKDKGKEIQYTHSDAQALSLLKTYSKYSLDISGRLFEPFQFLFI